MAEESQNFVLEYFSRIDGKVDDLQEGFRLFNLRVAYAARHVASPPVSEVEQGC